MITDDIVICTEGIWIYQKNREDGAARHETTMKAIRERFV